MTDPPPDLLRLRVTAHGDSLLRFLWGIPEWDVSYAVNRKVVEEFADEVRNRLRALVIQAKETGVASCKEQLLGLAQAGHDLYKAIFHAWEPHDQGPQHVQQYLNRPGLSCHLRITLDDTLYIPWGLVYGAAPREPGNVPDPVDFSHYPDFWCLKYAPAAMYCRIQARFDASAIPRDAFTVLPVLNYDVHNEVIKAMDMDKEDVSARGLFEEFKPAYSKGDLYERWKTLASLNGLLYFLCHASSSALELTKGRLTVAEWIINLTKDVSDHKTACLVFVNGCLTATGGEKSSFLDASAEHGFVGFIGTEAKVPDLFAHRFGLAFVRDFVRGGEPLFQLMDRLRRAHWPLSLLYSVYCFPYLRVVPPTQDFAPGELVNASKKKLGSRDL